jgi:hypothetical protein
MSKFRKYGIPLRPDIIEKVNWPDELLEWKRRL